MTTNTTVEDPAPTVVNQQEDRVLSDLLSILMRSQNVVPGVGEMCMAHRKAFAGVSPRAGRLRGRGVHLVLPGGRMAVPGEDVEKHLISLQTESSIFRSMIEQFEEPEERAWMYCLSASYCYSRLATIAPFHEGNMAMAKAVMGNSISKDLGEYPDVLFDRLNRMGRHGSAPLEQAISDRNLRPLAELTADCYRIPIPQRVRNEKPILAPFPIDWAWDDFPGEEPDEIKDAIWSRLSRSFDLGLFIPNNSMRSPTLEVG